MSVKVNYRVTDLIQIQIEANSVMEAVEAISDYSVLAKRKCGSCGSMNTAPSHRQAKGYDFYQHLCLDCGASLSMGQFRDRDALFVKDRDGWKKWNERSESDNGDVYQHVESEAPAQTTSEEEIPF